MTRPYSESGSGAAELFRGMRRRLFRARIRRAARAAALPGRAGVAELEGYGLRVAYPDRTIWLHQFLEIFAADCYGLRRLTPRARVVDAGANIGVFTLCALWRQPGAQVVAIEPDPANLEYLRRNVAPWTAGQVQIVPAALGLRPGTTRLDGAESDALRTGAAGGREVDVRALEPYLREPVDLLKMDIEGAECDALRSAGDGLRRVRRVVFEHHQFGGEPCRLPDCLSLLGGAGFDRFAIGQHRERPIPEPHPLEHVCIVDAWRAGRTT